MRATRRMHPLLPIRQILRKPQMLSIRRFLPPTLALALSLAAVPASAATTWLTDLDEARRQAAASDRLLLVDLYAEWCAWCHQLERKVFPDPTFQSYVEDRFVLLKVDTEDGGAGTELKRRFRVSSLPMTLLVDSDLVKIGEVPGFHEPADFVARLEAQLAAWKSFEARAARDAGSSDPAVLLALARELSDRGAGLRAAEIQRRLLPRAGTAGVPPAQQLYYSLAESLRRGGDLAGARTALDEAERALVAAGPPTDIALAERISLLRYHIAHDGGDCAGVRRSLEEFLDEYPLSNFASSARRTLRNLSNEPGRCV